MTNAIATAYPRRTTAVQTAYHRSWSDKQQMTIAPINTQ